MSGFSGASYQEGTYTPTLAFATPGDAAFVYSTQLGKYVRIGNLIKIKVNLVFTVTYTTSSGALNVSLPNTTANDGIADFTLPGNTNNVVLGAGVIATGTNINANGTIMRLGKRTLATNAGTNILGTQVPTGVTVYTYSMSAKYTAA